MWKTPICRQCKRPIEQPYQAIVMYPPYQMNWSKLRQEAWPFYHYKCLLKSAQSFASGTSGEIGKTVLRGAAVASIGHGGGVAYSSATNSINELMSINPKDLNARRKFQDRLNRGAWVIFWFASGLDLLILSAIVHWGALSFSAVLWLATPFVLLLAYVFTSSSLGFIYYLLYLEREIAKTIPRDDKTKTKFHLDLFQNYLPQNFFGILVIGIMSIALLGLDPDSALVPILCSVLGLTVVTTYLQARR